MTKYENYNWENEISSLNLDTRIWNSLRRNGIETLAQLTALFNNTGKVEIRNIGEKAKQEIREALTKKNIHLSDKPQCRISLYMCGNARVSNTCSKTGDLSPKFDDDRIIYCAASKPFVEGEALPFKLLKKGDSLEPAYCQACTSYQEIGGPLTRGERGWK